jgi:AAA15 family ATPase/GTPase
MARYYLSEIKVEGFRGINNDGNPLNIKFQKNKVNSVFAPNGAGKSSIFDALCFAIKGYIPRLKDMPRAENANDYYINKFHSGETAKIQLLFKSDTDGSNIKVNVKYGTNGARTVTSTDITDPDGFLRKFDHDCTLVDYRLFNQFVTSSPLERGRSFASLVGLSKLSGLKQALDSLSNTRNLNSDFKLDVLMAEINAEKSNKETCVKEINEAIVKQGGQVINPFNSNKAEEFFI